MDITQARDTIVGENIILQKRIDANNITLNILDDKFVAEFAARDAALAQATQAIHLNEEKDTIISTVTTEKEVEKKRADDAEALITEKDATIADLQTQLGDVKPIDPINPTPVEEVTP